MINHDSPACSALQDIDLAIDMALEAHREARELYEELHEGGFFDEVDIQLSDDTLDGGLPLLVNR